MVRPRRIVVVGASLAGLRAAEGLRKEGFEGELVIVGDEPHRPYNRPPLSKQFLAGGMEDGEVELRPVVELDAEWRLGVAATGLDLHTRRLALSDGSELGFEGLVVATGATARPLAAANGSCADLDAVFALRTLDDSCRLRAALDQASTLTVVGAGFIGCEVAATARALGLEVTMVDIAPAPMQPRVGELVAAWAAGLHQRSGVRLALGSGVAAIERDGRGCRIQLSDGTRLGSDLAVVGLGSVPSTGWLERSGVPLGDGVICDSSLAVKGVPGVVAAGDVVRWPHAPAGELVRIEHWSNAVEQGAWAARTLLHGSERAGAFQTLPSFWSDQHGVRIRALGLPGLADQSVLVEGSLEEGGFLVVYGRGGRVVGALSAGLPPRRIAQLRAAISDGSELVETVAGSIEAKGSKRARGPRQPVGG
jgi:NADPH-dependent 2,4-dienoyl-CoA reductase/sulfur reductase-like enzyme